MSQHVWFINTYEQHRSLLNYWILMASLLPLLENHLRRYYRFESISNRLLRIKDVTQRRNPMNSFKSMPELWAVRVTRITWARTSIRIRTWVRWARDNSWCCQYWRLVTWLHTESLFLRGNWTRIFSWVIFGKPVVYFFFISFNLIHFNWVSKWAYIGGKLGGLVNETFTFSPISEPGLNTSLAPKVVSLP